MSCTCFTISAQNEKDSIQLLSNKITENSRLRNNLWLNSQNATGLGVNPVQNYGHVVFEGIYNESDYKATFYPSEKLAYGMDAYGYKALDNIYLQGGFSFHRSDEDNIEWSSMMDTERDCPFILADSVGGDWKKDHYKLNMLAASTPIWNVLRLGLGVDYNVSTGGRDNDPRPKSTIKDLRLRPSVIFEISGKSNIGLTYIYEDYRQDIAIMNKYGVGGSLMYKIMGLALKEKPVTKSSIEYRIDQWNNGLALQYGYTGNKVNYISELTYKLNTEKGILYPYKSYEDPVNGILYSVAEEDYKYSREEYQFYSAISLKKTNTLHYAKLNARYDDGKMYNLSTAQVEMKTTKMYVDAVYELYTNMLNQSRAGKFLINAKYQNTEYANIFYAIQTIEKINFATEYDKAFLMFDKKFSANIRINYSQNLNSELNIEPESEFIEIETDITQPFVVHNYEYLVADYLASNVGVTYYGFLNDCTNYYITCYAGRLEVLNSDYFKDASQTSVMLKIGLLF